MEFSLIEIKNENNKINFEKKIDCLFNPNEFIDLNSKFNITNIKIEDLFEKSILNFELSEKLNSIGKKFLLISSSCSNELFKNFKY
jgi:hypothetical protein